MPLSVKASENTNLPQTKEIFYEVNKNLSEEQVEERFNGISEKYSESVPFSNEDAEFVVHYGNQDTKVVNLEPKASNGRPLLKGINFYKGTNSKSFNKSKTSLGVKVTFSGTITSHLNSINPGDQWYSGRHLLK